MNYLALGISGTGFLFTFTGIAIYFSKIMKNKVPIRPIGLIASLVIGMFFAAAAFYKAIPGDLILTLPIAIPAFMSLFMGTFFLWVLTQRKTPIGNIKVKVGDNLIPFEAKASDGSNFTLDNLKGKRVLFKFYRGAWCPYCSAELKMFEEMMPKLKKFNIEIVALSCDEVEEVKMHEKRDGLSYKLLADPDLKVIRGYGVEHQKAFGADTKNTMMMFGLPFPKTFKFKSMSIPTSILVDENGIIKWIDQSEDYRLRASEEAILAAVNVAF